MVRLRLRMACARVLILALIVAGGERSAGAQLAPPVITSVSSGRPSLPPSSAAYHVRRKEGQLELMVSFRDKHYPIDSMMKIVEATSNEWLARLKQQQVKGLELSPSGRVGVVAGQEAYAHAQIAQRLATPGLSMQDKGHTLRLAVSAFTNENYPARLPIAERYLTQLDALGKEVALWQMEARSSLVYVYMLLGRSQDVIRHGTAALNRLPDIPYILQGYGSLYYEVAQALSGQSDARPKIEALNVLIRSTYDAPADLLALDSGFAWTAASRRAEGEKMIKIAALLGTEGAPLLSNYWANRPTTDSAVIPVNDGKVRLIEIFSYGCDGCLHVLHGLQRIQERFPETVQAVATTFTFGYWGNRMVTPDEEATRLNDYFTRQLKVTYPVAIWKWGKVQKEDGGYRRDEDNIWATPNGINYPLIVKPTVYVLDGKGRIRRIFIGGGRELEPEMIKTVEFLQREAAHAAMSSSPVRPSAQVVTVVLPNTAH
jgi:hypothetical protein